MDLNTLYRAFLESAGISTDTRLDVDGTLFFGLRGERFDGNRFVGAALDKGCRLAITSSPDHGADPRVWVVESPLRVLQDLARHHRRQVSTQVIAITGSNGKTTTKELAARILSAKYRVLATRGNLNNHIGVPLTLLRLKDEEVAIVEMGANRGGEIGNLAAIAEPSYGMITNIGKAHLEGFGSEEGVLRAKGELYEYLAGSGGSALVDGNDSLLLDKAASAGVNVLRVGSEGELPVEVTLLSATPTLRISLASGGKIYEAGTRMVGAYNQQNIRLAAALGLLLDVPAGEMVRAISAYVPENSRSQLVQGRNNRIWLDAYNANPTSMREALKSLAADPGKPKMLILGDMAELGSASGEEHRALADHIGGMEVDRVLLAGEEFSKAIEPTAGLLVFPGTDALAAYLASDPPKGFTVLVKGSRVMELEKVVRYL